MDEPREGLRRDARDVEEIVILDAGRRPARYSRVADRHVSCREGKTERPTLYGVFGYAYRVAQALDPVARSDLSPDGRGAVVRLVRRGPQDSRQQRSFYQGSVR